MSPYAHITGWGMALPERVMSNAELAGMVTTTDEWIFSRTGIRERRIAAEGQTTTSLATEAGLQALEMANLVPADVQLIIVATSTPEHFFPSTACLVQDNLGAVKAGAFDLMAACSGFIFALNMATQAIRSGSIENALVIGAETLSRSVDWTDRGTCILFGDGAGAFVLQASETPAGVLSTVIRSDGSGGDLLSLPAMAPTYATAHAGNTSIENNSNGWHHITMNGREVFRFATRVMVQATEEVLEKAKLKLADVNLIVPHQANQRIIEAAARNMDYPLERVMINLDRYGNTSAASIPIAVCEAVAQGRLNPGDRVVFVGFGGGLTWGAALAEWTGPILARPRIRPVHYRWLARLRSIMLRTLRHLEALIWGRREIDP